MRFIIDKTLILLFFATIISSNNCLGQLSVPLSDKAKFTKLKLNTKDGEYAPLLHNGYFYFVSNRQTKFGALNWDKNFGNLSNIFFAKAVDSIRFSNIKLANKLNISLNGGPIAIAKSGIYFTSSSLKKSSLKENPLRIFFSPFNPDSTLADPFELDLGISDTVSVCHPAILNDSILYFTYYYKSCKTGTDIYYSIKKNTTWSRPIKCIAPINSDRNDEFPYIFNGTFFVSSNREGGLGGLDIYAIELQDPLPINKLAINSKKDDFGIYYTQQNCGYLSSNRNGNDDIFYFTEITKPDFSVCKQQIINDYCFTFKEKTDYETKDTVNMLYEWDFGDGQKARGLVTQHCFEGAGRFPIKLNVFQKSDGQLFENNLEYDLEVKNEKQLYISSYDTVAVNTLIAFDTKYSNLDNFVAKNYYWDIGDAKFYLGEQLAVKFAKPGKYVIKLLAVGLCEKKVKTAGVFKTIWVLNDFVNSKPICVPLNYKKDAN